MKYTFPVILALLALSMLLSDCSCGGRLCSSPTPVFRFPNYDSTTLHAVVVKQYNNNGQFTDLQSTKVYSSMKFTVSHPLAGDTLQIDSMGIALEYFNDYIVEVPAVGRICTLKNLSMQPVRMKADACTNGIKYILNDTLYTIAANPTSGMAPAVINIR
jgi:hypothetical protein